jgi:hypothetical protein
MGNGRGGYNTDVDGWVQVSSTVFPTMNLAQSVFGGDQYELALKVQLSAGNWWVRVGDQWLGYYPASLYNPAGLRSQADKVDWGGEIVDDVVHHPEATSTWMGSGHFPAAGWQWAAYMRNLSSASGWARRSPRGRWRPPRPPRRWTRPPGSARTATSPAAGGEPTTTWTESQW